MNIKKIVNNRIQYFQEIDNLDKAYLICTINGFVGFGLGFILGV